jgi:GntR family transcriptional regulator, vanillate catabolism transcriptional regulator
MIEHADLSHLAYKNLKNQILTGKLERGQKLVQEKIAQDLGISRMPLHKALQMLESEFLVESVPRKGYLVKKFDMKELIDAFECREVLEGLAARNIAQDVNHVAIANQLSAFFEPFQNQGQIDETQYRKADQEFHNAIRQLSNNIVLKKLDALGNYLKMTFSLGLVRQPQDTIIDHNEIIDAIRDGDPIKAEFAIRKHARNSIDILKQKQ